jgi:hypothetical protein
MIGLTLVSASGLLREPPPDFKADVVYDLLPSLVYFLAYAIVTQRLHFIYESPGLGFPLPTHWSFILQCVTFFCR